MEETILRELIKSRRVLKKKFRTIKLGQAATADILEKTYKPLTEPLKTLVKLSDKNRSSLLQNDEYGSISNNIKRKFENGLHTSTPKRKVTKGDNFEFTISKKNNKEDKEDEDDDDEYDEEEEEDDGDTEENTKDTKENTDNIDLSFLDINKKLDNVYGPYKDVNGQWKFGSADLKVNKDKIIIGNQNWASTPGLYELLFYKNPKHYDPSELEIYKKILLNTNAHKKNFNPKGQLKGNRGQKYKNIIKKIFNVTHTGKGLMSVNLQKPNYLYWDDPNELVERLKLLVASQNAGHTNQNNEIISIVEELREANIIH